MKSKRTRIFQFFVGVFFAELVPFFRLRHLTTNGGYVVYATVHTVLCQAILNFAGSFSHSL